VKLPAVEVAVAAPTLELEDLYLPVPPAPILLTIEDIANHTLKMQEDLK